MRLRASARLTQLRVDFQFFKLIPLTVVHFESDFEGGGHSPSRQNEALSSPGSTPALPGVEWLRFSGPGGFELRTFVSRVLCTVSP